MGGSEPRGINEASRVHHSSWRRAAWPIAVRAQQPDRMRRLGVLMAVAESDADVRKGIALFQQRLQELGWRDGHNIRIDYRWGDADAERIQTLAKELVDLPT